MSTRGKEPVFDIAGIEAVQDNGKKTLFKFKGIEYLAMNPKYSSDGGHLNSTGSKIVAQAFLIFLANIM